MYDVEQAYHHFEGDDQSNSSGDEILARFKDLAAFLVSELPESRYKSVALTNLEQAWLWADSGTDPKLRAQ